MSDNDKTRVFLCRVQTLNRQGHSYTDRNGRAWILVVPSWNETKGRFVAAVFRRRTKREAIDTLSKLYPDFSRVVMTRFTGIMRPSEYVCQLIEIEDGWNGVLDERRNR